MFWKYAITVFSFNTGMVLSNDAYVDAKAAFEKVAGVVHANALETTPEDWHKHDYNFQADTYLERNVRNNGTWYVIKNRHWHQVMWVRRLDNHHAFNAIYSFTRIGKEFVPVLRNYIMPYIGLMPIGDTGYLGNMDWHHLNEVNEPRDPAIFYSRPDFVSEGFGSHE